MPKARLPVRRFWFLSLFVLALAGAGAFYVWRPAGGGASDAPYRLAGLDRGPITASVRATGTLNPVTTVLVGSQLSGKVVEILVDYNSPVTAGQVVARLDATQIRTRRDAAGADVAQAEADLVRTRAQVERVRATRLKAEAGLADIKAQRDRLEAQIAEARRALDRQTELTARNVGAPTGLDAAKTQVAMQEAGLASTAAQIDAAEAELKGLEADLALAGAQVLSAEAVIRQRQAKLRDIEIDLERADIRSPVDGVVVQRQIDLGQTVAASLSAPTLFTVAQDLREIDIHANIDETDVGRLKAGQPVTFSVNAHPNRSFGGVVRMVRLASQTVQNVVTYTAVIRVENRDLALLPGMTANLQIVTEERGDALRVANAALRFRPATATAPVPTAPSPIGPATAAGSPRGGAMREWRERLAAEVQPTPAQAEAIREVFREMRAEGRDLEPAARRAARGALNERIAALLDPERRAKFEAMIGEGRRAAAEAGTPGRVYLLGPDGQPQAVAVRLGVTDGSVTEIVSGDIKDDAAVIVGGGPRASAPAGPPSAGPGARGGRGPRPF